MHAAAVSVAAMLLSTAGSRPFIEELRMPHVIKSVTINRPREEVYEFWRKLENLPRFMKHLKTVRVIGDRRSHWVAAAPAGSSVEWDAEIIAERDNELLAWRSLEGSEIRNEGSVRFKDAPADRGTEVRVELDYEAPGGSAGAMVAKLFGEEPAQQIRDDLRRFKQEIETGEVVRSDGSLEGAGQGAAKQRAAQAPEVETRR
jgi:uncharacterized membrane protein